MCRVAPNPYKNLLYKDYPKKNADRVNAMAREKVMSDVAKKQIAEKVYERLEPKINEKTANMNSIATKTACKLVKTAIEKAVNEGVDRVMLDITDKRKKT
ncbi:unnamed protein product [Rotaria sp. Silwood2]|nr:unnamed protein product [Rotaria sp. Silwood2]CAF3253700.1 unnamed protein product [Rotaria sp. Silwood2]CAF4390998.1 unnamed protein product [Rotaria sp. Silwood2]